MSDDPFVDYLVKLRKELDELSRNCIDITKEMQYLYAGAIVGTILDRYNTVGLHD